MKICRKSRLPKASELLIQSREIAALYKLKRHYKKYQPDKRPLDQLAKEQSELEFCYTALGKVSRSFSVVIQQLPNDLKDAVCVFYLVLRALDSIEDDTSTDYKTRINLLGGFYCNLESPGWNIKGVGDKPDYQILLENFHLVIDSYQKLDNSYQKVISDICQKMGKGMIEYLDTEIDTIQDYDNYCYYVAGLVGVGLTDLFIQSGIETKFGDISSLAISMGLFLQKTNIIRDFHEDLLEGRTFWPKEIWGNYVKNIAELNSNDSDSAHDCLNHMIGDALNHVGDCLDYLSKITDPHIFNFCAIPQVMAIATLAKNYGNPDVFKKNVKIRKGLTATLIFGSTDFDAVETIFMDQARIIFDKATLSEPNVLGVVTALRKIFDRGKRSKVANKPSLEVDEKMTLKSILK